MSKLYPRNDPGAAVHVPIDWEACNIQSKFTFLTLAIHEMGKPLVFTVQFSKATRRAMEASCLSPKAFVAKRFKDNLPGAHYAYMLEFSDKGVLHAHGVISGAGIDQALLAQRLRKVAGDKRKTANKDEAFFFNLKALDLKEPEDKSFRSRNYLWGWAEYCVKQAPQTRALLGCSPLTSTRSVTQAAMQVHKEVADLNYFPGLQAA